MINRSKFKYTVICPSFGFILILLLTNGYLPTGADTSVHQHVVGQRQFQVPVLINQIDNPVLRIKVTIGEVVTSATLEEIELEVFGPTFGQDINALQIYYCGKDSSLNAIHGIKKQLFGRSSMVGEKVRIQSKRQLTSGDHFFWVSCDLVDNASLDHMVSVNCSSIKIDGQMVVVDLPESRIEQRIGTAVRKHRQDGIHTSRIPGLAKTNKGTLLAVFDARYHSARDLQGDIDIGVHRSVDNGQTWEPMQIAMDMAEWGGLPQKFNGVSDACILVDRNSNAIYIAGLWMHGVINKDGKWIEGLNEDSSDWNHQWRNKASQPGFGVKETSQFLIVKSMDDGISWSKPVNLTEMCKKEAWWLLAPAPGNGITLSDGTLVFPTQGRDETGTSFSNITYSTDGGTTWRTSTPAYSSTTECAVVELSDNRVMLNMRFSGNKGRLGDDNGRAVAVTDDKGETWTMHPSSFNALPEPVCMASLFRHEFLGKYGMESLLLFSNPNSKQYRQNMTLKISLDDGNSWPESKWIHLDEGPSRGYSCLTAIDNHSIGILYESSQADLVFQRITIGDLR